MYDPLISVSTLLVSVTNETVDKSEALAPASVYVVPSSTSAGLSPAIVITGAVVSTTLTVLVTVVLKSSVSVTTYVIV